MVDRALTATVAARTGRVALPWWGSALAVFAASRVLSTVLLLWVGTQSTAQSRAGLHPSLLALSDAWDGQWYWWVAVNGYPSVLPHTASGAVDTNAWAFLPLYPLIVAVFALGSTTLWPVVAIGVSIAFGFGSAVLLAMLLRRHIGDGAAVFAVALYSVSPLAFVLQMAYAESMGLFLLFAALCLIDRNRYATAVIPAVLLAFTRPGVLALALAVAVLLVARGVRTRRGADAMSRREALHGVLLVAACTAAGVAWPLIAALATGVPDAYLSTETAWRALWIGDKPLVWFSPWFDGARFWTGLWFGAAAAPILGPVVVAAIVGALALLLLGRAARRLGAATRLWCAAYALYLLAVFFPQSSALRLLMPFAPLTGALVPRSAAGRAALLVVAATGQAVWLWVVLGPLQDFWNVL